jgi:hypothetical protein
MFTPYDDGIPIGDREGEHLHMERGRYDAWAYTVIAFVGQIAFLGATLGWLIAKPVAWAIDGVADNPDTATTTMWIVAGVIGLAAAWLTFRDRWRVNEAFSSRWCSGLANLSMLYVPVFAFVYANVRAIGKLRGR